VPDVVRTVYSLSGEIDIVNCRQVEGDLTHAVDSSPLRSVPIDCSDLAFIDSSGLHVLMRVERRLRDRGQSLVLTGVSGHFLRLLEITGLDHLIEPRSRVRPQCNRRP
jgi:anti-sigma B factor antagonist